ncbi:hypothetical protein [Legionella cincinnatiensis]|uniref:Uncharacterized conserved protein n=1 Tax=Legionella cincinnatiensis TaxID=28085 RepID=A0A378ILJ3_9GAMM|nr:hypothetical protein [Legionella cincinnatiensis]KTC83216.1 hypothetical protein Lcin_2588 [Legionella cincinnatiensis]STX35652.1 Uncharacterized conserved protein [Legionella cincinnatiensis]
MEIKTFQFFKHKGWSLKKFPELDSANTLVLIFAAPKSYDFHAPILQLADVYSPLKIVNCSTTGEIFGNCIFDQYCCCCDKIRSYDFKTCKSSSTSMTITTICEL